ncbi:MAG: class I SAM-dependent methyltransferase [Candidatus Bathyarchaeia archaeon]
MEGFPQLYGKYRFQVTVKIFRSALRQGSCILDIGCDGGIFAKALATRKYEVYGVDVCDEGLEQCLALGYHEVKLADVSRGIPYQDDLFDGAWAGEIIEHQYDTTYFLGEVYRILRPGAIFVLATPNLSYLANVLFLLQGKQLLQVAYDHDKPFDHITYYSPATLKLHLEMSGFSRIRFHHVHHPLVRLRHLPLVLALNVPHIGSKYGYRLLVSARKPG